jgi:hypothetical protein
LRQYASIQAFAPWRNRTALDEPHESIDIA